MNVTQISETALINCITILHTKKQTLGGSISFIEGDVFEVLHGNPLKLALGQELGVTIYSPEGLIVFDTQPIATYEKRVMCVLPPNFQEKIINRRKEIRVPIQNTLCLITGLKSSQGNSPLVELETPIQCTVENISSNGIRFLMDTPLPLQAQDRVVIEVAGLSLEGKVRNIQIGYIADKPVVKTSANCREATNEFKTYCPCKKDRLILLRRGRGRTPCSFWSALSSRSVSLQEEHLGLSDDKNIYKQNLRSMLWLCHCTISILSPID